MNIKKSVIYALLSMIDGKRYIGQLNCKSFQRAFAKDGKRSFRLIMLEACSPEKLAERERYWADYYRDGGAYNAAPVEVSPTEVSFSGERIAEKPEAETKKEKSALGKGPKPYKKLQPQKDD